MDIPTKSKYQRIIYQDLFKDILSLYNLSLKDDKNVNFYRNIICGKIKMFFDDLHTNNLKEYALNVLDESECSSNTDMLYYIQTILKFYTKMIELSTDEHFRTVVCKILR